MGVIEHSLTGLKRGDIDMTSPLNIQLLLPCFSKHSVFTMQERQNKEAEDRKKASSKQDDGLDKSHKSMRRDDFPEIKVCSFKI